MKRLLWLFLTVLLVGCASTGKSSDALLAAEDDALRGVVREACDQIPLTLFDTLTTDALYSDDPAVLDSLSEIPLLLSDLSSYRDLVASAFREALRSMHDIIAPLSEEMTISDPEATILASDDSATKTLDSQMGGKIKENLQEVLHPLLTESMAQNASIQKSITIWSNGKKAVSGTLPPTLHLLDEEALVELFYDRYQAELANEEIDLRTTPKMKGTGSYYEFFSLVLKSRGKR